MKRKIYIPVIVLLLAAMSNLSLSSGNYQFMKVTIETGMRYSENYAATACIVGYGVKKIKWVNDPRLKSTSISFYADEATTDKVISILRNELKTQINLDLKRGIVTKKAWSVQRSADGTFIRLIFPKLSNMNGNNGGC